VITLSADLSAEAASARIRDHLAHHEPFAMPGLPVSDIDQVVLRTSGSTGTAKAVGHTFDAVEWAAQTARAVLRDEGWRWLLMLSPFATGGFMTIARSVHAPLVWPGAGGPFDASAFAQWYQGGAQATSLVSTQLARLLGVPEGVRLLQSMHVVLVGGGPFPTTLRDRCRDLRIPAIATYGATETLGGCVYDGQPWPGVTATIVEGQIHLDGPNLARGYVPGPALPRPWPTGDLGRWEQHRLVVDGRVDDQVPVKGVNRRLRDYEAQALRTPGTLEAVAIAVADEVDGYRVVVFTEDAEHRLPRLDNGKPDRQELLRRARGQRR
jgi:O-succinylbenzoic acid--CoA ligase